MTTINRNNVTTVYLDLNENSLDMGGAWDRYKEYGKWLNSNFVLFYPSYTRGQNMLPEYINFPKSEDALAFKLKFNL